MNYETWYQLCGVKQHSQFETFLRKSMFDKSKREKFYNGLIKSSENITHLIQNDMFKEYFELYGAERKSSMQDYTPDSVGKILAHITRQNGAGNGFYSAADCTAGTGGLLIQKWNDDRQQENPWSYAPHNYLYYAVEYADNVIPYLIHNLLFRGINCIVIHGDTLTMEAKQVYFIQNDMDDFMKYSSLNVMPHSDQCMNYFGISSWIDDPIEHIESNKVYMNFNNLSPLKKAFVSKENNQKKTPKKTFKEKTIMTVGDIATVERAVKGKIYKKGTIIVQISATDGQVGMLKSNGEVESSKYACVTTSDYISYWLFCVMQKNIPKHFHRVQQGMNVPLEEIKKIPFVTDIVCTVSQPNLLDYGLKIS